MVNAGIHNNDIIIVDRSIKPKHGKIVVAALDGQMTVKRLYRRDKKVILLPENKLDLNDYLIKHPSATFFVRVVGDSMVNAGIHNNDIIIVDRSIKPKHGKIVVAALDGQMTVKRLYRRDKKVILLPENELFKPIEISDSMEIVIWGVATNVIHAL
jgi:SOS-response transcriptional repressor LexA